MSDHLAHPTRQTSGALEPDEIEDFLLFISQILHFLMTQRLFPVRIFLSSIVSEKGILADWEVDAERDCCCPHTLDF